MAKYKYLLWDIDGTILDFEAAESAAIKKLFLEFSLGVCSDEMLSRYSSINRRYWQALERGEMTKPEILIGRFREFFETEGLDVSVAEAFNSRYQLALGDTIVYCDNAMDIINELKDNYTIIVITNGTAVAQHKKLEKTGLNHIADHIFISEEVGFEKPSISFFERVISETGISDLAQALIIGDSLTSDILGGINSGIDTCWYNPKKSLNSGSIIPTYEINNLNELKAIL